MTTPARNHHPNSEQAHRPGQRVGEGPRLHQPSDDPVEYDALNVPATAASARQLYEELLQAVYPDWQRRAAAGEESAQRLLECFIALGGVLGVPVPGSDGAAGGNDASAASDELLQESFAQRRVPSAT